MSWVPTNVSLLIGVRHFIGRSSDLTRTVISSNAGSVIGCGGEHEESKHTCHDLMGGFMLKLKLVGQDT